MLDKDRGLGRPPALIEKLSTAQALGSAIRQAPDNPGWIATAGRQPADRR